LARVPRALSLAASAALSPAPRVGHVEHHPIFIAAAARIALFPIPPRLLEVVPAREPTAAAFSVDAWPALDIVGPVGVHSGDGLGKVDPDPPVVDEDVLHLEISLLGIFPAVKLDKCVLERVACALVADDLAAHDRPEPREYQLEVLVACHGVELADEEDVLRRADIGERQVPDHLEGERGGGSGLFAADALLLFLRQRG